MRYKILSLLAIITMFNLSGYSDEIQFKNGNILTGKITQLTDGKLLFKSNIAGDVKIDISSIQTISSETAVTVNLKDGTGFTQKLNSLFTQSTTILRT